MLEIVEIEERAAKCHCCSGELSIIENMLYGNRCLFCLCEGSDVKTIGLFQFLALCYYDYKLHREMLRLIVKSNPSEARMLVLGYISEVGGINIRDMRTIKDKRALLKALKRKE